MLGLWEEKNSHLQFHYFLFQSCKKRLTQEGRCQSQSHYELFSYTETSTSELTCN